MVKVGCVYFITFDNAEWRRSLPVVKIGQTTDLQKRLGQLNTGSPFPLTCAGMIETSIPKRIEYSVHALMGDHRLRLNCEWFRVDEALINRINCNYKIKNPRFDELFADLDVTSSQELRLAELQAERDKMFQLACKYECENAKLRHELLTRKNSYQL